jgi:hypothetical protein
MAAKIGISANTWISSSIARRSAPTSSCAGTNAASAFASFCQARMRNVGRIEMRPTTANAAILAQNIGLCI